MSKFESSLDKSWTKLQKKLGRDPTSDEAEMLEGELFEEWIRDKRFDELIAHLHETYDLEGGATDCIVLGKALRDAGEAERVHKLFRGLIASRTRAFWRSWPEAQKGRIGHMRDAAKYMSSVMDAYAEYWHNLWSLKLEQEGAALKEEMLGFQSRAQPPARPGAASKKSGVLNEKTFWTLIETARTDAGSETQFADALEKELARFTAENIERFDEMLHGKLDELNSWDLWAFAYLARGGCSDDSFDYFRAWVVAQGKAAFGIAVRDPNTLLPFSDGKPWDLQCEHLLSVADGAHKSVTGKSLPQKTRKAKPIGGEKWTEAELASRYPYIRRYFDEMDER